MDPIRRILVATDFSDGASAAVDWAARMARQVRACVQLVSVVDSSRRIESYGEASSPDERIARIRQQARARLMQLLEAKFDGLQHVDAFVFDGDTTREILRAAAELKCDVIVVGTRGRKGLSHVLNGSTAEKLVRQSEIPVLTIRAPNGR